MTDITTHIEAAEQALRETTTTYGTWKSRLDAGKYKNPESTKWWQAFDHLRAAKVLDAFPEPPPPPPPPPPSGWGDFFGLCAYRDEDASTIASLGVKHVRMDRPSAARIEAWRAKGVEVLPIACYNPWSDLRSGTTDKYPPDTDARRAEWAKRMVFTWFGMADPPDVCEVWNEPWLTGFWQPAPNAGDYLKLVKAFCAEAWAKWPNLLVLVSADSVGDDGYFRQNLLAADSTGFLNDPRIRPTTHNYVEGRTPTQVTSQPCWWDLDRFKCAYNDFKTHGHPNPKVWVTEMGWESDKVGEQKQADYHVQALGILRNSGMVEKAYSFFLKTNDGWSYNWLRGDNSQKPVCAAVKGLIG